MNQFPQDRISRQFQLSRPLWMTEPRRQTAILLRDASTSMEGSKADVASLASASLVQCLASPANNNAFDVSIIDFASAAKTIVPLLPAGNVNVPAITSEGCTNVHAALIAAEMLISSLESSQARPIVLIFSDGQSNGEDPLPVAQRMKACCDIVSVAFGDDADQALLQAIASTPEHFFRVNDNGAALRDLFVDVGNSLSVSIQTGQAVGLSFRKLQQTHNLFPGRQN